MNGRSGLWCVLLATWVIFCWGIGGSTAAEAQTTDNESDLVERYEAARRRLIVQRHLRQTGGVPVLPPVWIATPTDSLRPPDPDPPSTAQEAFPIQNVRAVSRLERDWFREKFSDVNWSFLGASPNHTFFDTTRTSDLRARLEAEFGAPTQTLGDLPADTSREGRAQFEYWFVVNDSIPAQVTDAEGPRGRGLILVAERRYRKRLRALRDTLLAPLRESERAPYVDYYYDRRLDRWYRAGFDGDDFFLDRVSRADVVPGQRPHLDSTATSPGEESP